MPDHKPLNRRSFLKGTAAAASLTAAAAPAKSQDAASQRRVLGSNDRINIAQIGVGGRGGSLQRLMLGMIEGGQNFKITAVCDVYEKRRRLAQENSKAESLGLTWTPSSSQLPTTGTERWPLRRSQPGRTFTSRSR